VASSLVGCFDNTLNYRRIYFLGLHTPRLALIQTFLPPPMEPQPIQTPTLDLIHPTTRATDASVSTFAPNGPFVPGPIRLDTLYLLKDKKDCRCYCRTCFDHLPCTISHPYYRCIECTNDTRHLIDPTIIEYVAMPTEPHLLAPPTAVPVEFSHSKDEENEPPSPTDSEFDPYFEVLRPFLDHNPDLLSYIAARTLDYKKLHLDEFELPSTHPFAVPSSDVKGFKQFEVFCGLPVMLMDNGDRFLFFYSGAATVDLKLRSFLHHINQFYSQIPIRAQNNQDPTQPLNIDIAPPRIITTILKHYDTLHGFYTLSRILCASKHIQFDVSTRLPGDFWFALYSWIVDDGYSGSSPQIYVGDLYLDYLVNVDATLAAINQQAPFRAQYIPEAWKEDFNYRLDNLLQREISPVAPKQQRSLKDSVLTPFFALVTKVNESRAFNILNQAGIPFTLSTIGAMTILVVSPLGMTAPVAIGVVALGAVATVSSASYSFYQYLEKHKVKAGAFLKNTADKVRTVYDTLTLILGAIAKSFAVPLAILDAITTMLVAIVALAGADSHSSRLAIGYLFARVLKNVYPNLIDSIMETFTNLSSRLSQRLFGQGVFTTQGTEEEISALGEAANSVGTIFGSLFGRKHERLTRDEVANMHAVHSAYTLVNDLKSLVTFAMTFLSSTFQWCYTRWTGHPLFIGDSELSIAKADAWIEEVKLLQVKAKKDAGVYSDLELCREIDKLSLAGEEIARIFVRDKISPSQFPAFFAFAKHIYDLKSVADHARRIGFGRAEPTWVHFDGPPGLGKTTLLQQLCADIARYGLGRPFTAAMVYAKTFTKDAIDAYWSGYANQSFFLCEEIWQYNDEELRANTAVLFNQLVNVHTHALPMADIGSKGNTIFDTPFILSTSNGNTSNKPTFSKMQDPSSVYRRMTFECVLQLKPGRKNDPERFDSTSWLINIVKMRGDASKCRYALSYVEFLQLVLAEYVNSQHTVTRNVVRYLNNETSRQRLDRWVGPLASAKIPDDKVEEALEKLIPTPTMVVQGREDFNWKGHVLEFVQLHHVYPPDYTIVNSGPPHLQEFRFQFKGSPICSPPYFTKKLAEQAACKYWFQTKYPREYALLEPAVTLTTMSMVGPPPVSPHSVPAPVPTAPRSPPPMYKVTTPAPVPVVEPVRDWMKSCAAVCIEKRIPFPAIFIFQKDGAWLWDSVSYTCPIKYPSHFDALQAGYKDWFTRYFTEFKSQGLSDAFKGWSTSVANWWKSKPEELEPTYKEKFLTFREKVRFLLSAIFVQAANNLWLADDGKSFVFKMVVGSALLLSFGAFLHYIIKNQQAIVGVFEAQSYGADFKSRRAQTKQAKPVKHIRGGMRKVSSNTYIQQGGSDIQTAEMIWNNLAQAGYTGVRSHLFFIDQSIAVAPLHSFRELASLSRKTMKLFSTREGEVDLEFGKDFDLVVNSASDMLFFQFHTNKVSPRRNLAKHLVKSTDLEPEYNQTIACVTNRKGQMFVMQSPKSQLVEDKQYQGESGFLVASSAIIVNMPTVEGECGAPYFSTNDKDIRKIYGIHIAGDKNQGMAQILSLEAYEEAKEAFEFQSQSKREPLVVPEEILEEAKDFCDEILNVPGDGVDYPATVVIIGTLKPHLRVRQPPKTELRQSLIFGVLGVPARVPVRLSKHDVHRGLTPQQRAMQKFALPNIADEDVDPEVSKALDLAADVLLAALPTSKGVVFTLDEALNGHPKYRYFRRIDDTTSVGWPLTQEKVFQGIHAKGKKYLLDEIDGRFVMKPEFLDAYNKSWDALVTKLPLRDRTFQISLKDELRDTDLDVPVDDCTVEDCPHKQYKPRIFNPLPFFYQIHQRRLYGEFVNMMMEWHNESFSRVGVNPHSLEWALLFRHISEKLFHKDGDFKGFDASQPRFLGQKGYALINAWYEKTKFLVEDACRRKVLTETMKLQIMACLDKLIALYKGNPSGSFLTTVLNEILVMLAMMTVFYLYCQEIQKPRTMTKVYEDIRCPSLGDDHILSEDEKIPFNRLKDLIWKCFGMKYTCAAKTSEALDDKPLAELTFLKRRFRPADGLVFAPLEMDVIVSMLSYIHVKSDGGDPYQATRNNARSAIQELYHHGRDIFEEKSKLINLALEKVGIPAITLTYASLDESYRGGTFEIDMLGVLQYPHQFTVQGLEDGKTESTAQTTSQIAITAVSDLSPMTTEVAIKKSTGYGKSDPYVDQGLRVVLERVYYKNFQWTASQIFGQDIYALDLPKDHIIGNDNLVSKLSKFQFFRSATLVQLRVNSTSFHTGRLLVAWIPHYKDSGTLGRKKAYELFDVYAASCNEHVVLSANSTDTVSFIIPYVAPQQYFDLSHLDTAESEGYFGYVKVFVLSPLMISSSVTVPPVNVAVSISFVDPEVAGLTSYSIPPMKSTKKKAYRVIEQRDFANGSIKGVFKTQGIVGETPEPVPQNDAPLKEQQSVSSSGVVSSALSTVGSIASMFSSFPVIGGIASIVAPVANIASSIASSLGFDKPVSAQVPTQVIPTPFPNLAEGKGLDPSQVIGLVVENGVSADPSIFCDSKDYTKLTNYAGLPALIGRYLVVNGEEGDIVFSRIVTPNDCYTDVDPSGAVNLFRTPLNAVADKFRFWTGSLKYALYISVPHFVSFRFRLSWCPSYLHKPLNTADGAGDYISKVVDVNGSQVFYFSIPYLQTTPWCASLPLPVIEDTSADANQHGTNNGVIQFSIVNDMTYTDSAVPPTIDIALYQAGGEDLRFACPRAPWSNIELGPFSAEHRKEKKMTQQGITPEITAYPRRLFEHTFDPLVTPVSSQIVSGINHGEEVVSFKTLAHRYTKMTPISPWVVAPGEYHQNALLISPEIYGATNSDIQDFKYDLDSMFLFNRGSKRFMAYKLNCPNTFPITFIAKNVYNIGFTDAYSRPVDDNTNTLGLDGQVLNQMELRPAFMFQVPFYDNTVMRGSKYQYPEDVVQEVIPLLMAHSAYTGAFPVEIYEARADDFSWGWPKTPLKACWLIPPAKDGKEEEINKVALYLTSKNDQLLLTDPIHAQPK